MNLMKFAFKTFESNCHQGSGVGEGWGVEIIKESLCMIKLKYYITGLQLTVNFSFVSMLAKVQAIILWNLRQTKIKMFADVKVVKCLPNNWGVFSQ